MDTFYSSYLLGVVKLLVGSIRPDRAGIVCILLHRKLVSWCGEARLDRRHHTGDLRIW
jgi:hypothetical protein